MTGEFRKAAGRVRSWPVDPIDVVAPVVDRVVGFELAVRDAGQAGLLHTVTP